MATKGYFSMAARRYDISSSRLLAHTSLMRSAMVTAAERRGNRDEGEGERRHARGGDGRLVATRVT